MFKKYLVNVQFSYFGPPCRKIDNLPMFNVQNHGHEMTFILQSDHFLIFNNPLYNHQIITIS